MASTNKLRNEYGLTPFEENCCAEFVRNGGDQSAAFIACHKTAKNWKAKSVWENASKLFSRQEIADRVKTLMEEAAEANQVSVNDLVAEYASIAFSDIRKLFDQNGNLKPLHELDKQTAAFVAAVDTIIVPTGKGPDGEPNEPDIIKKIKLWDKLKALDALGKHIGFFKEDNDQKSNINLNSNLHPALLEMMGYKHDAHSKAEKE